jgi:hypothetical protein
MKVSKTRISRRQMLLRGAGLLGGLGLILALEANKPAIARAAKSDFLYQDHPRDGQGCAQCKFFSPDSDGATTGTCAIVDGQVNRNGWCLAYSPRH